MDVWRYIVIFSAVFVLCVCRDVSYYELETLGVSCRPHDTCNTTSANLESNRRNCGCDNHCAYFGDCCLDVGNPTPSNSVASTDLVCVKTRFNAGYFAIGKCRRGWRDAETRRKCESHPNSEDPLSSVPVTTSGTTFTYKNRYCAKCNDIRDTLLYWKLGVECSGLNSSLEDYVQHNLTYDTNTTSWGVYIEDKFYACFLKPVEPKQKRYLRFCYPNLVSNCSSRWTDDFIREKCESYTAYLHIREEDVTYRNVHCALCNNISLSNLSCDVSLGRGNGKSSFTTLFDVNSEENNATENGGTSAKCNKGETFDSAFKRCQKLSCGLPFLELRNGSCVPKSKK